MAKAKHERSSFMSMSGISILSSSGATMAVGGFKSMMCSNSIFGAGGFRGSTSIGLGVPAGSSPS